MIQCCSLKMLLSRCKFSETTVKNCNYTARLARECSIICQPVAASPCTHQVSASLLGPAPSRPLDTPSYQFS